MAAQLMSGKGFRTIYNVSGGIRAWKDKTAIGSPDLGMTLFDDTDSPLDVLKIAYSLEEGLREFYISMAARTSDQQVKAVFSQLSEIEVKHQRSIYQAYCDLDGKESSETDFETSVEVKALEGGLSTDEYLDLFKPDLASPVDVISMAMSIEAQALDLYQRVGERIDNPESKKIIHKIANEEKAHLASLGKLMDKLLD